MAAWYYGEAIDMLHLIYWCRWQVGRVTNIQWCHML